MSYYTDNQARGWSIDLNVTTILRIKNDLDIDLYRLDDESMLMRLATDPFVLAQVLYLVCEDQTNSLGVSPEDFGRGLGGEVIESASMALLDAIADFFPSRRRELVRGVIAKLKTLDEAMLDQATAQLEAIDLQTLIDAAANSGDSPTDSPASSESTRAP